MSEPQPAEPLRYQQVSEEASGLLAAEGESGRFEFNQTAEAVSPDVLVAAANWAAMNDVDYVTLLVGVAEREDPDSGLVSGKIIGLRNLARAIHAIQSRCVETQPVPIGLTLIEEGVATPTPFLRLKIRPTAAPHYDDKGRRVTRNNASTRPLTDQELLDLYLDREAEKFEQRFQRTAGEVLKRLGQVSAGVEELLDDLGYAGSAASEAVDEAQQSKFVAERTEHRLEQLHDLIEGVEQNTPYSFFMRLGDVRLEVWLAFAEDAAVRPTKKTDQLIDRLSEQLQRPIDGNQWVVNCIELQFWRDALERRGKRGTMTSWAREIATRERFDYTTVWPLGERVNDLRAELAHVRNDKKKATPSRGTPRRSKRD
jgi:hypothetical protein